MGRISNSVIAYYIQIQQKLNFVYHSLLFETAQIFKKNQFSTLEVLRKHVWAKATRHTDIGNSKMQTKGFSNFGVT